MGLFWYIVHIFELILDHFSATTLCSSSIPLSRWSDGSCEYNNALAANHNGVRIVNNKIGRQRSPVGIIDSAARVKEIISLSSTTSEGAWRFKSIWKGTYAYKSVICASWGDKS